MARVNLLEVFIDQLFGPRISYRALSALVFILSATWACSPGYDRSRRWRSSGFVWLNLCVI